MSHRTARSHHNSTDRPPNPDKTIICKDHRAAIWHSEGRFSAMHGAIRQTEGTRTLRNRHTRRNIQPKAKGHDRCGEARVPSVCRIASCNPWNLPPVCDIPPPMQLIPAMGITVRNRSRQFAGGIGRSHNRAPTAKDHGAPPRTVSAYPDRGRTSQGEGRTPRTGRPSPGPPASHRGESEDLPTALATRLSGITPLHCRMRQTSNGLDRAAGSGWRSRPVADELGMPSIGAGTSPTTDGNQAYHPDAWRHRLRFCRKALQIPSPRSDTGKRQSPGPIRNANGSKTCFTLPRTPE